MKLTYFQGSPPNFGDELNATMWRDLLPRGFLNDNDAELFIGIGSVIQTIYPDKAKKIVLGSGFGGYSKLPDVHDGTWDIRFVRGPQTAKLLGLDPKLVIADSAILLRETSLPEPAENIGVAFMPHYQSKERGAWQQVCKLAGIRFIDPTEPTDKVIAEIRGADLLISEAMHGAIVADALRTPWIGVRTMHHMHRVKWQDWADALNINYKPAFLFPSNCREAWTYSTGRSGCGPRAMSVCGSPFAAPLNAACRHIAARNMQTLAKSEPQLSNDINIQRATERALEAVDLFVQSYTPKRKSA